MSFDDDILMNLNSEDLSTLLDELHSTETEKDESKKRTRVETDPFPSMQGFRPVLRYSDYGLVMSDMKTGTCLVRSLSEGRVWRANKKMGKRELLKDFNRDGIIEFRNQHLRSLIEDRLIPEETKLGFCGNNSWFIYLPGCVPVHPDKWKLSDIRSAVSRITLLCDAFVNNKLQLHRPAVYLTNILHWDRPGSFTFLDFITTTTSPIDRSVSTTLLIYRYCGFNIIGGTQFLLPGFDGKSSLIPFLSLTEYSNLLDVYLANPNNTPDMDALRLAVNEIREQFKEHPMAAFFHGSMMCKIHSWFNYNKQSQLLAEQ